MKTAKYIRVSTTDQNIDRQSNSNHKEYVDKCSGSIPFNERPNAKKLMSDLLNKKIDTLVVHSIDRLGRNAFDIQTTLNTLSNLSINVYVENIGLYSMIDNKPNSIFKMITDVLSNVAEMERASLLERQKEGIIIAKAKGVYKGRRLNTIETPQQFLSKYNQSHLELIKDNKYSIRKLASITNLSNNTIIKIRKILN
ncbi:DNA invertase Pin-like site-specific DNA recombinase [Flavobacterium sp. 2755]|uniref:recombinase family protein n=1 Tax=Flavobacterium sp. 2755 TaxID=2817765 RepID=UPI0028650891|nr:recombinase family protein [Flavobacterium sp. 2755]MDR6761826.1 DNA invertase Pin-like site-specific DNA recombinase [Flavobacterium sp. 2755]